MPDGTWVRTYGDVGDRVGLVDVGWSDLLWETEGRGQAVMPGDLLWCRSAGKVAALIRFGERVHAFGWPAALRWVGRHLTGRRAAEPRQVWGNHIAVYVGNGFVVEALASGLTLTPVDHYRGKAIVLSLARVTDRLGMQPWLSWDQRAAAVRFALEEADRRDGYGWLGIASIVAQLLTSTRIDVTWDGTMICSAFGARVWEHAGVALPTRNPATCFPSDLARWAHVA